MSRGEPLDGDRGAKDVISYGSLHANDIEDSTLRRHLPLPGAAGGHARSDGTDWQRVSEIPLADIASYAQGSLIYGAGVDWGALAVGNANAFLTNDGTDVAWSTGLLSITAAKTLTVSNSLTLAGTDGKALTLTDSLTIEGGNAGTLHFDAAATVTVSASCTINNWFDQSVKQAASPTFADVFLPNGGTIGIDGNELLTFNAAGTAVFSGCNVGIGQTPNYKLDLYNAAGGTGLNIESGADDDCFVRFRANAAIKGYIGYDDNDSTVKLVSGVALSASTQGIIVDASGNVGAGTAVFGTNAATVLGIANGTEPTTSPADMIQLFSMDISGGAASLGIRTEEAVTAGAPTPSHKIKIKWNGTEYWLSLDAV